MATPKPFARNRVAMRTSLSLASLPLLLLTACSQSTTAEPDSGITFMAPDATADSGSGGGDGGGDAAMTGDGAIMSTDIGQTCGTDTDCSEFCATDGEGFRDGYCTQFCDDMTPCPGDSICLQVSRDQSWCFAQCDPSAADRPCRAGYGCAVDISIPAPVCIPGCTDDTDCPDSTVCNPEGGGRCYSPDANWGDACAQSTECPDGAFCFAEAFRGWPGGMCIAFGCDPADTTGGGCPMGTECVTGGGRFGRCVVSCETTDDCRDAYTCQADMMYPDRMTCQPACENNSQCTESRVCTDMGTCG